MTKGDKAWLFSKVILFLIIGFGMILVAVVAGVALGDIVFLNTHSRWISTVVGLGVYFAVMGGRDWVLYNVSKRLFSATDAEVLDKAAGVK